MRNYPLRLGDKARRQVVAECGTVRLLALFGLAISDTLSHVFVKAILSRQGLGKARKGEEGWEEAEAKFENVESRCWRVVDFFRFLFAFCCFIPDNSSNQVIG